MATPYEIDVKLLNDTAPTLHDRHFSLYGFKAVKTSLGGGQPLVWFKTQSFLATTVIIWEEQYEAYISTSDIKQNVTIRASNQKRIDLNAKATVTSDSRMIVTEGGTPHAITIKNKDAKPWTCGISQQNSNGYTQLCAFPLSGHMEDVIAPIEKVLLMFATETVNTGTVIEKAYSEGVMINLTAAQTRALTFDINAGWDWGGQTWGTKVTENELLSPILIAQS